MVHGTWSRGIVVVMKPACTIHWKRGSLLKLNEYSALCIALLYTYSLAPCNVALYSVSYKSRSTYCNSGRDRHESGLSTKHQKNSNTWDRWQWKRDVPKLSFKNIQKRNRLKIRSYRRYGEHGEKYVRFSRIVCWRCCTRRNLRFHVENSQHADQKQLTRR